MPVGEMMAKMRTKPWEHSSKQFLPFEMAGLLSGLVDWEPIPITFVGQSEKCDVMAFLFPLKCSRTDQTFCNDA